MRPLLIAPEHIARIDELIAFAKDNVHDIKSAIKAAQQDREGYRDMMAMHAMILPVDYLVTYSHEKQNFATLRHISISVKAPDALPAALAVQLILHRFRMAPMENSIDVWIEEVGPGENAINVCQPLEEDMHWLDEMKRIIKG